MPRCLTARNVEDKKIDDIHFGLWNTVYKYKSKIDKNLQVALESLRNI